ncbi:MAG: C39 family peptidase [Methanoregula sp.]|nr:C39 family peptidase [Methanoregula sp.]
MQTCKVTSCILVLCLVLIGFSFLAGCTQKEPAASAVQKTPTPTGTIPPVTVSLMLTGVPDVRQAENYSCGASSFQAVMSYYGLNSMESDLRAMLNTTPAHGTYPWDMVRVAKQQGLDAEWKENLTVNELESALRQGIPVIIDGQRFRELNSSWENTWASGHYMVVIGLDDRHVYLEDPFLIGSRLEMTREDFVAIWHDYESELPVPADAKKYYHLGVFIRGTPPTVRPEFIGPTVMPSFVLPAQAAQ